MTLEEALLVLLDVHCGEHWREDDWAIRMGARPEFWQNRERYAEAWRVVREHRLRLESR